VSIRFVAQEPGIELRLQRSVILSVPQSIILLATFRSVKNLDLFQPIVLRDDVYLSIFALFERFVARRDRADIITIGLAHNILIPIDCEWDRHRVIPVPVLASSFTALKWALCTPRMVARVVVRHFYK
jgi:hypothetical protein